MPGVPALLIDHRAAVPNPVQHLLLHHRCRRMACIGALAMMQRRASGSRAIATHG
jgi:hypothetical protein